MLHPTLPEYDFALVIRTDFSDDVAWEQVCELMQEPQTEAGCQANVECISDKSCSGLTPQTVASVLPPGSQRALVFLVDTKTIADREHPILVVDLLETPGSSFRVIPSEAWGVENNVRLANVGFSEFAQVLDEGGVFRGFPRP